MNLDSNTMTDCKGKKFVVGTELNVPNTLLKATCVKIEKNELGSFVGLFEYKCRPYTLFTLSQDSLNTSKWEAESLNEYIKRLENGDK